MSRAILLVIVILLSRASAAVAEPPAFPGKISPWQGSAKHDFDLDGLKVTVVVPAQPLAGRPWLWRGEFFGAFADADVALVKAGWHLVYVSVPNLFGSPKAIAAWDKVYAELTTKYELAKQPGLIGLSRGGLYAMNWAAARPDKTLAVYLDNAVCDFKSWPGGKVKNLGTGKGSAGEWANVLKAFDFQDDAAALAYKQNPVDNLEPLAKAKIPLLLVYGDSDTVVPHAENSAVVYERYKKLNGPVEQIVKPGQDHHPHGLKDVTPVVEFFTKAWGARKAE
jgi:pimeloyl-ACP methyl ester carboxylesterase